MRFEAPARNAVLVAVVLLGTALSKSGFAQQQPSIVGTWEWTRKANQCAEQYVFREDGTVSIRSGDALSQHTYRMAWAAEPNGRYKMTLTTVKKESAHGCVEASEADPSLQRVYYILFGGSRRTMIVCDSPAGADCIGPLKKTAG